MKTIGAIELEALRQALPQPAVSIVRASGVLIVGDPHVSSRRPGRRNDGDYPGTVLGALSKCLDYADANDLQPIITGDLVDRAAESDISTLFRLSRVLRQNGNGSRRKRRAIMIPGNHDQNGSKLTGDTTVGLLASSNLITVYPHSGVIALLEINRPLYAGETKHGKMLVALGGTPYGQEIPTDVRDTVAAAIDANAEHLSPDLDRRPAMTWWLTHHDLDIQAPYPGCLPIREVKGCDLVINGHMHFPLPPAVTGGTTWFNPGNITRQRLDEKDRDEMMWSWVPDIRVLPPAQWPMGYMNQHSLGLPRNVFDETGLTRSNLKRLAKEQDAEVEDEALDPVLVRSLFADLLKGEGALDMKRTDDGSVLLEEIGRIAEATKASQPTLRLLLALSSENWNLDAFLEGGAEAIFADAVPADPMADVEVPENGMAPVDELYGDLLDEFEP